ncbi:Hypothetical Protein FCC1311_067932 [Hondaea fermentalgiana]|uniref:Uncharacterized protein n=1 Tax=Hondaea fermentalgiana TaxID=2315210 RepID=A0A2R5GPM5_9STRA|nr:Hypothetical Protein FCC1311_067932 [Hondaea fermentalgiana]|eukprot:GBG30573.1 Hypothetical Protein FCC1311_067932 [Hondaea fermentalgiana]
MESAAAARAAGGDAGGVLRAEPRGESDQELELRVRLPEEQIRRLAQPVPADQRFPGLDGVDEGYEAAEEDFEDGDESDAEESTAKAGKAPVKGETAAAASWEDFDLDAAVPDRPKLALSEGGGADTADESPGEPTSRDADDWPVILVDVTPWTQDGKSVETARHEIFEELLKAEDQIDQLCEAMFEVGAFHHSTELCVQDDVARLETLNAGKRYAAVNYPEVVHVADLFETRTTQDLWREIARRASAGDRADAARLLKERVRDCSRSLVWKRSMLEEIDVIAEREELARLEREEVSERIESLTAMASELEELWASTDDIGDVTASCAMQLQAVQKHLADAREEQAALESLEAQQQNQQHKTGPEKERAEKELSVVDMILAMVLQRSVLCLPDMKHVGRVHKALLRKWELQFGRLPYISHTKDAEARQRELHKQAQQDALWDRAENLNDDLEDVVEARLRGPSPEGDIDKLVAWIEGNEEPESEHALPRRRGRRGKPSDRRDPRDNSPTPVYKVASLDETLSEHDLDQESNGAKDEAHSAMAQGKTNKKKRASVEDDQQGEEQTAVPAVIFDEAPAGEDPDEEDPVAALVRRLPETNDAGSPLIVLDVSSSVWHLLALVGPFYHVLVHNPKPLARGPSERILDAAFSFIAPDTEESADSFASVLLDAPALEARADEDIEEAANEFLAQFAIRVRTDVQAEDLEGVDVVLAPNCPTAALACALAHRAIEDKKLFAISVDTFHADYNGEDTWALNIWPDIVDSYPMDTPSGLTHNFPHY